VTRTQQTDECNIIHFPVTTTHCLRPSRTLELEQVNELVPLRNESNLTPAENVNVSALPALNIAIIFEARLTNAFHIRSGRFRMQKYVPTADDVINLHSENTTVPLIFTDLCIVIYFYSTTNKMHLLSQIIYSCKTLYMFRGLSVHHQELKTAYTATVHVKQLLLSAAITAGSSS
jgi:hypothetical protein